MRLQHHLKTITNKRLATSNNSCIEYALTVLIEPRVYQSAIKLCDPIDYLAKNLKRHLKAHGIDTSSLWFALEFANKAGRFRNPHIHGSITINHEQHQKLLVALQSALGKPRVKSAARKRTVRAIYSTGWIDYCFKDIKKTSKLIGRRAVYVARELTKFFGKKENSSNALSPDTARVESDSSKVCLVTLNNPSKNTQQQIEIPVQKIPTQKQPKTIHDLLEERELRRRRE